MNFMFPFTRLLWAARFFVFAWMISWLSVVSAVPQLAPTTGDESTESFTLVDPPPITQIVMFNSGLAQFIHSGEIDGNCQVEMNFTDADIDNVLKSLVFEDRSKGLVRSVEFKPAPDKQDVAARKIGPPLTLAQTLQKYRGEKIIVRTNARQIEGSIWSVESRQQGDDLLELVTIINDRGLTTFFLTETRSIRFTDKKLNEEFKLAMTGIAESRSANLKKINLQFSGKGKRVIRFSYNVDAPIWRMTYRLNASETSTNLQAWAHIDNVMGVDWQGIQLKLRSGRPQAFHVDLFRPVLASRPSVGLGIFGLPIDRIINPELLGFAQRSRDRSRGGFGGGGRGGGGFGGGVSGESSDGEFDLESSIESAAIPSRPAQLVQFDISDPVYLKAGRSSMVPVISENVTARWRSLVDADEGLSKAKFAALYRNELGYPLVPGPVTLFRNGEFAGDAAVGRTEPGQLRTLFFGIDESVAIVKNKEREESKTKSVTFDDGNLVIKNELTHSSTVRIINRDELQKNVLLRTSKLSDDVEPKPDGMDGGHFDYEIAMAGGETVEKVIRQTRTRIEKKKLDRVLASDLKLWEKHKAKIPPVLLDHLKLIIEQVRQDSAANERYQIISTKISDSLAEQKRITSVLKALTAESKIQTEYFNLLSETEATLKQLRTQQQKIEKQQADIEAKLNQLYNPAKEKLQ